MKSRKVIRRVLLTALGLIVLVLIVSFVNHRIQLHKEDALFQTNGQLVEVNGHGINVYVAGNAGSDVTLVFMSGAGTCSPTLDFKSLYSLFENDYQIAVVEKAGYGFSDDCDASRDIDTMLSETREAIGKAGVTNQRFILFPHSMSGIEALYWANRYPDEVKAIVGLDASVPAAYENMKIPYFLAGIAKAAADIGLTRFIPSIVNDSAAIKYGNLTQREKELYRAIFYRRTMDAAMLNEMRCVKLNAEKLASIDSTNVPMLFFASNGDGTGYKKDVWRGFIIDYVSQKGNREYILLDCSHYVHDIEYEKIYKESVRFIKGLQ